MVAKSLITALKRAQDAKKDEDKANQKAEEERFKRQFSQFCGRKPQEECAQDAQGRPATRSDEPERVSAPPKRKNASKGRKRAKEKGRKK